jgi:hypothetical protein
VGTAERLGGSGEVSAADQFANAGGGARPVAGLEQRHALGPQAMLSAQAVECADVALRAMAEGEVRADDHRLDVQPVDQDLLDEVQRCQSR